jgi:hypothetical protein
MTLLSPAQAEAHLSDGTPQFAQWRQSRPTPRGARIPEARWAEAIARAEVLPPTRGARHLGIKPHVLKRRRGEQSRPAVSPRPSRSPAFVAVTAETRQVATTEVEVARPDGTRLRIPSHDSTPALAPLRPTFLEHR